ncbi:MAG: SEC-C metal-binding domain-containing protein, partial [Comamonas sp.]
RECYERGQPVLVGTTSIENSEIIDELLNKENLPHQVLNAKQHEREADIIAQAGRPGMITIATNMAGRGTDIVLGGNIEKQISMVENDESLSESERKAKVQELRDAWKLEHDKVSELGGLRIIATERHESRRIDNQLRGRAGRQGDKGSSRFYLSLDDQLMRIFAGDRVKSIMERLKMPDGEAIEAGIVTRSIESAQRKVEARNFDMRKQLLEYDDVSNDQRKVIYQQRNEILDADDLSPMIDGMRDSALADVVRQYVPEQSMEEQWDVPGLEKALREDWQIDLPIAQWLESSESLTDEEIEERVVAEGARLFNKKLEQAGKEHFMQFMRAVLLQTLDSTWRDHLAALDYLRQGIHLRGYAQKQPKQEYKREAFELFRQLIDQVKTQVTRVMMQVQIRSPEQLDEATEQLEQSNARMAMTYSGADEPSAEEAEAMEPLELPEGARVGRNDPCPCGSGKKFKLCHGKLS